MFVCFDWSSLQNYLKCLQALVALVKSWCWALILLFGSFWAHKSWIRNLNPMIWSFLKSTRPPSHSRADKHRKGKFFQTSSVAGIDVFIIKFWWIQAKKNCRLSNRMDIGSCCLIHLNLFSTHPALSKRAPNFAHFCALLRTKCTKPDCR